MFRSIVLMSVLKIQRWSRERDDKIMWRDINQTHLDELQWKNQMKMQDMTKTIKGLKTVVDTKEAIRESLARAFRAKTEAEKEALRMKQYLTGKAVVKLEDAFARIIYRSMS